MREALGEAERALALGEVPVGAVVARGDAILSRAHNLRETLRDPTAHAEVLALREAARALGDWRLTGCSLFVTLEPCAMCAGAIVLARVERVIYGARDAQRGCCGSVYRISEDAALGHTVPATGGVLEGLCEALLRAFYAARRAPREEC